MASTLPRPILEVVYEAAAQEYLRSLPLEHFMEATTQATQREITLASLALVKARRPDVHVFNELLVQYPRPRQRRPGQVVPDNMVVISDRPVKAISSYNTPLEAERPFWVMEYVSKSNKRKDYEDSFDKYENELKVPYYLVFHPEEQELTLFRHNNKKYATVKPNRSGRYAIPELDLEIGLHDGWVRYWYKGKLLPLPADMQHDIDKAQHRADEEKRRADEEKRRADEEKRRADELQHALEAEREARVKLERDLAQLRSSGQAPSRRNGPKA